MDPINAYEYLKGYNKTDFHVHNQTHEHGKITNMEISLVPCNTTKVSKLNIRDYVRRKEKIIVQMTEHWHRLLREFVKSPHWRSLEAAWPWATYCGPDGLRGPCQYQPPWDSVTPTELIDYFSAGIEWFVLSSESI